MLSRNWLKRSGPASKLVTISGVHRSVTCRRTVREGQCGSMMSNARSEDEKIPATFSFRSFLEVLSIQKISYEYATGKQGRHTYQ